MKSTNNFAIIALPVFKLLSRKVLFINKKDNRNCYNVGHFLRKQQISRVNSCKIVNDWNPEFLGQF